MNVPVLQPSQQAETPNFYYRKSPSAPEGAFGGSVANAVLNSADTMSSIAAAEKHKADVQTVLDVSNQMTADLIKAFNGPDGFRSLKGESAVGVAEKAQKYMQDLGTKHMRNLSNDDQVAMLKTHMKENAYNFMRDITTYESNQLNAVKQERYQAGQTLYINAASANYTNSDLIKSNLQTGLNQIDAYAATAGLPAESIKLEKYKFSNALFTSLVKTAMDNNDVTSANNALTMGKEFMDPVTHANLQKSVAKVQTQTNLYAITTDIIKNSTRADGSVDVAKATQLYNQQVKTGTGKNLWTSIQTVTAPEMGKPYQLGGDGKNSTDCGKFILDTFNKLGINLEYRTVDDMYRNAEQGKGNLVLTTSPQPGDIVFYNGKTSQSNEAYQGVTHAGIYAGDDKVLQAGVTNGVSYAPVDMTSIKGYAKVTGAGNGSGLTADEYKTGLTMLHAKIADQERIHNDTVKNYRSDFAINLLQAPDAAAATKMLDNADPNIITPQQKEYYQKQIERRYKNQQTAEEAFWFKYEKEGLYRDLKNIQLWNDKLARREDIDEKDLKKYQESSLMVNRYWQQAQGLPATTPTETANAAKPAAKTRWYEQQVAEIKAKYPNATDAQIQEFLTKKIMGGGW